MPDPGRVPAADWLIAEYDATGIDDIGEFINGRRVTVQPMIRLKSDMDAGEPMSTAWTDYLDPGRWWL
jgi:hypothetical protein